MAAGQNFTGFNGQADALYNSEKLSKVLQILYTKSVMVQISEEHKEYEMLQKKKAGEENGRSYNFMLQTDFGPSAVGASATGEFQFKDQDQSNLEEKAAIFKQKTATIGLSYSLLKRAAKAPTFENPLAVEVKSKAVIQKRLMASEFHRDGTAIIAQVATHTTGAVGAEIVLTLAAGRGGEERYCEYGDILLSRADADGSESVAGLSLEVVNKDRAGNTITVKLIGAGVAANELDDASLFRKADTDDFVGNADFLSNITAQATPAGVAFDQVSLNLCGLETLYAADGRKVHEITMSGVTAGTVFDGGGNSISLDDFHGALDDVKIRNGRASAKWTQLLASNETLRSVIDGQEQDRRLWSNGDTKRGFSGFGYIHDNSTLEMVTTEYVRSDRIWSIPQADGVCMMIGKDYEDVSIGGQKEFMAINSSGARAAGMRKYLCGYLVYLSKRPAYTVSIRNFIV
ncbi:MAG: hypothetical protein GY920_20420 [Aliivibrio sp.]|nr:hypothetical protein [Aliivibrio sp.]MCP4322169.1 hypothetical protein [Alteromonadales bacterium]